MKKILIALFLVTLANVAFASHDADAEAVKKASINYLEGFYEGDTEKLTKSLAPTLYKFGFWKKKGADTYEGAGFMTFEEAIKYASDVKAKKHFPKPDAPKEVVVLEVSDKIAITKVTAWWGVDYILLAKNKGAWKIRQVLWEGPTITANPTDADRADAKKAGLGYLEGFYEGDPSKLKNSLRPNLYKFGYGLNKKTGEYYKGGQMKFDQAIAYAKSVKERKNFPKADAPRKVEVLDVMNHIAAVKVTAWWGIDYMLLSKTDDKWMIEQVLWAGVRQKKHCGKKEGKIVSP